ncbi:MAG: hypothetical protein Q8S19_10365, partial [Bacillota bacterium]|nr:hypothetical protein [Bacillota bacterium]
MLFKQICEILVHDVGLTLRKTAEHLATAHQRVHETLHVTDRQLTHRQKEPSHSSEDSDWF